MSEQSYPVSHFSQRGERFSNFFGTLRIAANNAQIQTDICKMRVECWFGNTEINLLNPELAGREVHLYINGGLSEVKIQVPPGTKVSRPVQVILGEFSFKKKTNLLGFFTKEKEPENTDMAFHLIIYGSVALSNISVRY
jgi:predicted membrane protein